MSNFRNWTCSFFVAALILLAPIIGFAVAVTAEMVTDLVTKIGTPVVLPVAGAALGWVLLRKYGWQPRSSQLRSEAG